MELPFDIGERSFYGFLSGVLSTLILLLFYGVDPQIFINMNLRAYKEFIGISFFFGILGALGSLLFFKIEDYLPSDSLTNKGSIFGALIFLSWFLGAIVINSANSAPLINVFTFQTLYLFFVYATVTVMYGALLGKFEEKDLVDKVFKRKNTLYGLLVALPIIFLVFTGSYVAYLSYIDFSTYDYVKSLTEVKGNLAYVGIENYDSFIVYNGKKYGEEYSEVGGPTEVDGKLAFAARNEKGAFVVVGGERKTRIYDSLVDFEGINSSLYLMVTEGNSSFLVKDGKKIREINLSRESFLDGRNMREVGGKLAYSVYNSTGESLSSYIIYNGDPVGSEYDSAFQHKEVNGSLAYLASEGNQSFVVYKGKRASKKYDYVTSLAEINEKPAYFVSEGNRRFFVVGEEKIYPDYDAAYYYIFDDPNGLIYLAGKYNKGFILVQNKDKILERDKNVNGATKIDDQIFIAIKDNLKSEIIQKDLE